MDVVFRQHLVNGRFPMAPLFLRPMRVQLRDLLIPFGRQRRTPTRYGRSAVLLAIGNNADLDFISREPRCHDNVLHPAIPNVVCREQPESFLAVTRCCSKHGALALDILQRVNETRRPIWRPLSFAYRSEKTALRPRQSHSMQW